MISSNECPVPQSKSASLLHSNEHEPVRQEDAYAQAKKIKKRNTPRPRGLHTSMPSTQTAGMHLVEKAAKAHFKRLNEANRDPARSQAEWVKIFPHRLEPYPLIKNLNRAYIWNLFLIEHEWHEVFDAAEGAERIALLKAFLGEASVNVTLDAYEMFRSELESGADEESAAALVRNSMDAIMQKHGLEDKNFRSSQY